MRTGGASTLTGTGRTRRLGLPWGRRLRTGVGGKSTVPKRRNRRVLLGDPGNFLMLTGPWLGWGNVVVETPSPDSRLHVTHFKGPLDRASVVTSEAPAGSAAGRRRGVGCPTGDQATETD